MRFQPDEKQKKLLFAAAFTALLLLFCYFLIYGSLEKEFWYDEMAMVGFVCGDTTIPDLLHTYLTSESSNLPLYAMLLWPVYHFLPAQEACLLMLSMVLTLGAVILLALFARKRYGDIAALLVVALCTCSTTVRNRIGLELRAYSLMFFGASFSLYALLLFHEKTDRRRGVLATAALLSLIFSHYFGVLFFALLAVGALVCVLRRKQKFSFLIPFPVAGGLFTPWFVLTRIKTDVSAADFWIPRPVFADLPETVAYLLGGNMLLTAFFGIAWIFFCVLLIREKKWLGVESFLLLSPAVILGGIFVYSRYLSRGGGLYENRYFIAVLPAMLLIMAGALQKYWDLCASKKLLRLLPFLLLLPALVHGNDRARWNMNAQIRDASDSANYILQQGDVNDTDVRIVALSYDTIGDFCARGWGDFYLARQAGVTTEVLYTRTSGMDGLFEEYAAEGVRRIYLMADEDFWDYYGTQYRMTELENTRRLTIFDRIE